MNSMFYTSASMLPRQKTMDRESRIREFLRKAKDASWHELLAMLEDHEQNPQRIKTSIVAVDKASD